jgi:HEAT repeat protein
MASSSLNPAPLYIELIRMEDCEAAICVALIGLAGRNDQDAFDPLNRFIESECKEIRIRAVKALLQYSHLLPTERISELIRHPDWEIRAAAAKAVGEQQLDFDIEALSQGMSDEEWWVRYYSAAGLAQRGSAGYADPAFVQSAERGT